MPGWLEGRLRSRFAGRFLVLLSLVLYVLTKISATLFAGQIIVKEILPGINMWAAVIALILGTAFYVLAGGLSAVIWTEAMQTIVLFIGGFALLGVSLGHVGGWRSFRSSENVPEHYFHVFRPATDAEFPWTGFLTGYYCTSLWYWCCDQVIVQRALAARSLMHGRGGCVGAAYLKLLPGFIMVLPGMIARQLMFEEGVLNDSSENGEYDRAFTWLVLNVMPKNAKGIMMAGMMAALMSSLASVLNSCSIIVAYDVYAKWKIHTSEKELIWVGRVTVAFLSAISCAWLLLIPLLGDNLFIWIQKPPSYVAPAVLSVFLFSAAAPIVNAKGAAATLCIGCSVGLLKLILEVAEAVYKIPMPLNAINFLHFSALNFGLCTAILFGVSALTNRAGACEVDGKFLFCRSMLVSADARDSSQRGRGDGDVGSLEMVGLKGSADSASPESSVEAVESRNKISNGRCVKSNRTLRRSAWMDWAIHAAALGVLVALASVLVGIQYTYH